MLRTTLNPDRSQDIAKELVGNEQVRSMLTENLSNSVESQLPSGLPVTRNQIEELSDDALEDPEVESVLIESLAQLHKQVLEGDSEPLEVDSAALTNASRDALAAEQPELAQLVSEDQSVTLTIPTNGLGFVSSFRSLLKLLVPIGALAALALTLVALFVSRNRPAVLRKVAFWAFGAAAFWLIVGIGLPRLIDSAEPSSTAIAAAVLTIFFKSMTTPSIILFLIGIALMVTSIIWPKKKQNKELDNIEFRAEQTHQPTYQSDNSYQGFKGPANTSQSQ